MASDHENSGPAPKLYKASDHNCLEPDIQDHNNEPSSSTLGPKVVPTLDTTISSSLQELELLCSPMFDEYFNGGNQGVSKSSTLSGNQHQDTLPQLSVQPTLAPSTPTKNVNAEENNNDQVVDA
ncbi:hypothetical protein Tco_0501001 [Tanacetum coccineum]